MFTLFFLSLSGKLQMMDALEIVVKEFGFVLVGMGLFILFQEKKHTKKKTRRDFK